MKSAILTTLNSLTRIPWQRKLKGRSSDVPPLGSKSKTKLKRQPSARRRLKRRRLTTAFRSRQNLNQNKLPRRVKTNKRSNSVLARQGITQPRTLGNQRLFSLPRLSRVLPKPRHFQTPVPSGRRRTQTHVTWTPFGQRHQPTSKTLIIASVGE